MCIYIKDVVRLLLHRTVPAEPWIDCIMQYVKANCDLVMQTVTS